jgi:serine/threonine protein kinase
MIDSPFEQISIGDYAIGKVIGKGGFGIVYKAIHRPSDTTVALKSLEKDAIDSPSNN